MMYGLTRCAAGTSCDDCRRCLRGALAAVERGYNGSAGMQVLRLSCMARYESYPFYNATTVRRRAAGIGTVYFNVTRGSIVLRPAAQPTPAPPGRHTPPRLPPPAAHPPLAPPAGRSPRPPPAPPPGGEGWKSDARKGKPTMQRPRSRGFARKSEYSVTHMFNSILVKLKHATNFLQQNLVMMTKNFTLLHFMIKSSHWFQFN